MRSVVYVIAALAAVGIMVGIVVTPSKDSVGTDPAASNTEARQSAEEAMPSADGGQVAGESQTLVLHVPDMHCPFGCYPAIKEVLEGDPNVATVELAAQQKPGEIDNRRVIITYGEGFDLAAAVDALAKRGFKNSEVSP